MDELVIFSASKLHIIIAIIAVLYFLYTSLQKKVRLFVLGAITLPSSYIIATVTRIWVETERPFSALGVDPLVEHIADNGFPSEHTLYALIIAGVIWSVHKKLGYVLLILALLVGISRVIALVHNPIDIIGSILIALVVIVSVNTPLLSAYVYQIVNKKIKIIQQVLARVRVMIDKN